MIGTIRITTRAATISSITLIYKTRIVTLRRRAVVILPNENSEVDGNAKDPYFNDIDHDDDNCENNFVTGFRRERLLTYRLSRRFEGTQAFMLLRDW